MVAGRDPEVALALLPPTLDLVGRAVRRFGGTVNRVTGDGVMALFGAPHGEEEHALGACCAAVVMNDLLARSGLKVQLRVGIHTGELIVHALRVGDVNALEAAGEAVHLAARLQQEAAPGEVILSHVTFGLARGRATSQPLGLKQLRGFAAPVEAHLLTSADPSLTRLDVAGRQGLSRFIGRQAEWARMRAMSARAAAGHGGAIALTGEPGIGKSRMIREFAADLGAGIQVVEARGIRWRDDAGFYALRPVIRRLLGLDAAPSPAAIAARLDAVPEGARAALVALLGLPPAASWSRLEASQRRRQMVDACTGLCRNAARLEPLVLIFDDLQWADPESQEVLEQLLAEAAMLPFLLVLGWRPEFTPRWADLVDPEILALAPLASGEARELVQSLLPHAQTHDYATIERVASRSAGNPYFIEEATAALPELTEVPASVRSVLSARLDRLTDPDKRMIELLAVVGEPAGEALLDATLTTQKGQESVMTRLPGLERSGFLRVDGVGAAARVSCRHALLQDVVYGGLTSRRKREWHAAVAVSMERLAGAASAEEAEVLSRHARLGGLWEAALRHARTAAGRAIDRFANREAAGFFEDALAALAQLPEDAAHLELGVDLRLAMRDPLFRLGRTKALRDRLDEAEKLAEGLGEGGRLAQLRIFQCHHAWLQGDNMTAAAAMARAAEQAEAEGNATLALRVTFQRGMLAQSLGAYREAASAMAEVAENGADPAHGGRFGIDPPLVVVARGYRARLLADLGEMEEAAVEVAHCNHWAEQVNRPFSWIFARMAEGYVMHCQGQSEAATVLLAEALAQCERAEAELMRVAALMLLGIAELGARRAERAREHLALAVEMADQMRFMAQQPMRLAMLAWALLRLGRLGEARARAAEALAMAEMQGDRASEAAALLVQAELPGTESRALLHRAAALADALQLTPLAARVQKSLAAF